MTRMSPNRPTVTLYGDQLVTVLTRSSTVVSLLERLPLANGSLSKTWGHMPLVFRHLSNGLHLRDRVLYINSEQNGNHGKPMEQTDVHDWMTSRKCQRSSSTLIYTHRSMLGSQLKHSAVLQRTFSAPSISHSRTLGTSSPSACCNSLQRPGAGAQCRLAHQ